MSPVRRCSRTACGRQAVATLTYVYADSTAVLGPLAIYAEPHCYDLCADHSERLTAPRGWQVVRLAPPETGRRTPSSDDLEALALAVREAARAPAVERSGEGRGGGPGAGRGGMRGSVPGDAPPRRGHLRAVTDDER